MLAVPIRVAALAAATIDATRATTARAATRIGTANMEAPPPA